MDRAMPVTPTIPDYKVVVRDCPLCGHRHSTHLMSLTAPQIFGANWSYRTGLLAQVEQAARGDYPIVRCDGCGFTYASRRPEPEFLAYLYDEVIDTSAAKQHSYSTGSMAARMRYLAQFLPMLDGRGKVLDFGCGFGPTLSLLGQVQSIEAHGFETSALRATELRQAGLHNIHEQFEALAAAAPFDGLILDNVLEHLPDPRNSLGVLASICRSGALAYVSVPDMGAKRLAHELRAHGEGKPPKMDINPWEHLNYFSLDHLDAMLGAAGFTPLKQMELASEVNAGLRAESNFFRRAANSLASSCRIAKYVGTGDATVTPNARFYRLGSGRTIDETNGALPGALN